MKTRGDTVRLFLTFTKKSLAVTVAAVIVGILILGKVASLSVCGPDGSTHAIRMQYLRSIGVQVEEEAEQTKEIVIPETFSDVYETYNQLQRRAGFDLADYKGKKATVYTYRLVDNSKKTVTLIVCGGRVIGGDIADAAFDGEMQPLPQNTR